MITQGQMDELESAQIATAALRAALESSTVFDRPAITEKLAEACRALIGCSLAILDSLEQGNENVRQP